MKGPVDQSRGERALRTLILILVYGLAAGLVSFLFLAKDINQFHRAKFIDMVYGRADKPYVYRTLIPSTIRLINGLTPESIRGKVADRLARGMEQKQLLAAVARRWEPEHLFAYLIGSGLIFGCFFAFAWIMRGLIDAVFRYPSPVTDFAPVFSLLFLAPFFRYRVYLYDPGTLLLFPLALWAALRQKRILFVVIFIPACFNKETSLLLAGFFGLLEYRRSAPFKAIVQVIVLGAIWLLVKALLFVLFRENGGSLMEFHLIDHNLSIFIHQPFAALHLVGFAGLIAIFVFKDWAEKPAGLRQGLAVILLPLLILSIFWGYIDELRVYFEAYPLLFLLALPTVLSLFGIGGETQAPSQTSP